MNHYGDVMTFKNSKALDINQASYLFINLAVLNTGCSIKYLLLYIMQ